MLVLLSLYLTYAGVVSFALAMNKHHVQAFERRADAGRISWLRFSGTALLLAALGAWIRAIGLSMGLVSWLLWVLPLIGIIVAAGLAFMPRLTARAAFRISLK